jgi:hypothetical protein
MYASVMVASQLCERLSRKTRIEAVPVFDTSMGRAQAGRWLLTFHRHSVHMASPPEL